MRQKASAGINVPISVDGLIERVWVGPLATDAFLDRITDLLKKHSLAIIAERSRLGGKPPRQRPALIR
jgi:hypothetical protein